ncbi:c-type cytochrome [Rubrolithibacter danxiaensis]|uniref:c-type cytochrome n=1 Tax=Rubrolithibacter danxiaensis TaxID=3390805 RepID=UPI003BF919F2
MKRLVLTAASLLSFSMLLSGQTKKAQNASKTQQPGLKESIARGQKVYTQYCVTCHQVDGSGVPRLNPPLIKTSYVLGDKTELAKIVLNGFNEQVEIDGEYYSNTMPPFKALSDQEVADVLTYVRNNFGNKASQVNSALVKMVRATLNK